MVMWKKYQQYEVDLGPIVSARRILPEFLFALNGLLLVRSTRGVPRCVTASASVAMLRTPLHPVFNKNTAVLSRGKDRAVPKSVNQTVDNEIMICSRYACSQGTQLLKQLTSKSAYDQHSAFPPCTLNFAWGMVIQPGLFGPVEHGRSEVHIASNSILLVFLINMSLTSIVGSSSWPSRNVVLGRCTRIP